MQTSFRPHLLRDDYWIGIVLSVAMAFFGWQISHGRNSTRLVTNILHWASGVQPNEGALFAIGFTFIVAGAILFLAVLATLARKAVFTDAGYERGKVIPYRSITKLDFASSSTSFMGRDIPWHSPLLHYKDDIGVSRTLDLPPGQSYLPQLSDLLRQHNPEIKISLPKPSVMRRIIFWTSGTGTIVNVLLFIGFGVFLIGLLRNAFGFSEGTALVTTFFIVIILLLVFIQKYELARR